MSLASSSSRRAPLGTNDDDTATAKARLRLWLRILKVSRFIEREVRERLRVEFETTLPRFDVLAALYRSESGLNMSELSTVLRVSNGNVTGIIDRLVADGLVTRAPVENDRRALIVRMTANGRAGFSEIAKAHQGWVSDLLNAIDAREAETLIARLGEIGKRADFVSAGE